MKHRKYPTFEQMSVKRVKFHPIRCTSVSGQYSKVHGQARL